MFCDSKRKLTEDVLEAIDCNCAKAEGRAYGPNKILEASGGMVQLQESLHTVGEVQRAIQGPQKIRMLQEMCTMESLLRITQMD